MESIQGVEFKNGHYYVLASITVFWPEFVRGKLKGSNSIGLNFRKYSPLSVLTIHYEIYRKHFVVIFHFYSLLHTLLLILYSLRVPNEVCNVEAN